MTMMSSPPCHCHTVITSPLCHTHPGIAMMPSSSSPCHNHPLPIYAHSGLYMITIIVIYLQCSKSSYTSLNRQNSSGSSSVFCTTTEVATLLQISLQTRNTEHFLRRAMMGLCSPPPGLPAPLPVDGYRNLLDTTRLVGLMVLWLRPTIIICFWQQLICTAPEVTEVHSLGWLLILHQIAAGELQSFNKEVTFSLYLFARQL